MKTLLFLCLLMLNIQAEAAADDNSERPDAIIASVESSSQNDTTLPTELIVDFDPTQFIDDVGGQLLPPQSETAKKSFLIRSLEKSQVVLPQKISKLFDRLKVPEGLKRQLIDDYLMPKLQNIPEALSRSKAHGGILRVYGMAGLGLSDYLLAYLKSKKWGQWLPSRASFGISLGAGTSLLFFEHEGKRKIMIRFFASAERSDVILNWMSEALGLVSVGRVSDELVKYHENPRSFGVESNNYTRSMLNVAGNLVAEKNYFEYNFDLAAGLFIPGGFYELKGHYMGLYFVISRDFIKDMKQSISRRCERLLSSQ